ncbi:hypothetical protein AMR42_06800 [Limnothrix sp. PR1529]|nr:hypothetical protein BCR12_03525 [Limnothrix sp. P13C2]PIB14276.1 hypothetical protein AMR42_06800 [Limnothrix sp. PR1529]
MRKTGEGRSRCLNGSAGFWAIDLIDRKELTLGDLAARRTHGDAPLRDLGSNGSIDSWATARSTHLAFNDHPRSVGPRSIFGAWEEPIQSFCDSF